MVSDSPPAPPESGPVIGVSWPRSGHHMLVRLLTLYFGPGFGYCDFYGGKPRVAGIETCCGRTPCIHAERIKLTKSHDFDLDLPQIPGQKYLIQYRAFAPSVVSNFELFVRNGGEDSMMSFHDFASSEFTRYLGFVERWVRSDFAKDQLVLDYSTFLADPQAELARTIAFVDPADPLDAGRIARAIERVDGQEVKEGKVTDLRGAGIHAERSLDDFRHCTPWLQWDLENLHLPHGAVIKAFRKILDRDPNRAHMLYFQSFPTVEELETYLRNSDEYKSIRENE